jgi:hypothetical protein
LTVERRQFERLPLPDHALAIAEDGRELGQVSEASGGGMMIQCTPEVAKSFQVGQRMRVTVVEPGSQTRNVIDVVVRYVEKSAIGMEFVTGKVPGT